MQDIHRDFLMRFITGMQGYEEKGGVQDSGGG